MEHRDIESGQRHAPHNWEYADAAARAGAVLMNTDDLHKWALQLSDGTYWRLIGVAPATWLQVAREPQEVLEIAFAFGDATPTPIALVFADQVVTRVEVFITTEFDGIGAAIEIGDDGQVDRLMGADENDPAEIAGFVASPVVRYGADTALKLSITPGAGATQGAGFLVLTITQ